MNARNNVQITTKSIPAIRLGMIVARIPASATYTLTQDAKRTRVGTATNVALTLSKISPIALGKLVSALDASAKEYSVTQ